MLSVCREYSKADSGYLIFNPPLRQLHLLSGKRLSHRRFLNTWQLFIIKGSFEMMEKRWQHLEAMVCFSFLHERSLSLCTSRICEEAAGQAELEKGQMSRWCSPRVLKARVEQLCRFLWDFFNPSLSQEKVPVPKTKNNFFFLFHSSPLIDL